MTLSLVIQNLNTPFFIMGLLGLGYLKSETTKGFSEGRSRGVTDPSRSSCYKLPP